MQRPATLRDVAARSGVHTSTASRALNPTTRSLVNSETVDRVLRAAGELGYRPNSLARGLKTNRTQTIGMLLPDLTNPLFPPIVRGIEDTLGPADYTLILANTDNHEDRERQTVAKMIDRRVDGLILATAHRNALIVEEVLATGLPVVLVNRTVDNPLVPAVTGDDHAGVGLALNHLVGLGHTRIAHVGGPQHLSTGLTRHRSFLDWMGFAGLVADPALIAVADGFHEDPGAKALRNILDDEVEFTAVVAANDLLAIGCYDVLNDSGRTIGADVSVVGYNDMPFADRLNPPLTTVRIPHYQMGIQAASVILQILERPEEWNPGPIRLTPSLVVRQSTGPALR
jgi:LacI family transcriptional regulator